MHQSPLIGVQAAAFLAHCLVASVTARRHRAKKTSALELTGSAACIESPFALYPTLSTFPMLIPMTVVPMVSVDLTRAIGMNKANQMCGVALVLAYSFAVQVMYIVPRRDPALTASAAFSLALFCTMFAVKYRHWRHHVGLAVCCVALSFLMLAQICIPYVLYQSKQSLLVLVTVPTISSIVVMMAAFVSFKMTTVDESVTSSAVLHAINQSLKHSALIRNEGVPTTTPAGEPSEHTILPKRTMSVVSTTLEGREASDDRLYHEGYCTDTSSESGYDLTVHEFHHHDAKDNGRHLGRLMPSTLSFD